MLDIGIFGPFGPDHERNIAFCRDADIHHNVLSFQDIAGDATEVPSGRTLRELVDRYAKADVRLMGLTPPRLPQAAFSNEEVRNREISFFGQLIESMGEAGMPYVHFYLNVDEAPEDADERERLWEGLAATYRELTPIAEAAGVKISTHHFHLPDRLLWNYETMTRLLRDAQSEASGVTFCQGKSVMAGDDMVANILDYGDKIFMFHVRDVVTKVSKPVPAEIERRLAEIGYLEVPFGAGEVDMVGCFRALKQINYSGQIYPEHFPAIAGDHAAGLAMTIGYMRALDQAVEA